MLHLKEEKQSMYLRTFSIRKTAKKLGYTTENPQICTNPQITKHLGSCAYQNACALISM